MMRLCTYIFPIIAAFCLLIYSFVIQNDIYTYYDYFNGKSAKWSVWSFQRIECTNKCNERRQIEQLRATVIPDSEKEHTRSFHEVASIFQSQLESTTKTQSSSQDLSTQGHQTQPKPAMTFVASTTVPTADRQSDPSVETKATFPTIIPIIASATPTNHTLETTLNSEEDGASTKSSRVSYVKITVTLPQSASKHLKTKVSEPSMAKLRQ